MQVESYKITCKMWFTYLAKLFSKVSRSSCWSVENQEIGNYHIKNTNQVTKVTLSRSAVPSHSMLWQGANFGVDDRNNKGSKGYVEDNDIVTMPHHLQNHVNNF